MVCPAAVGLPASHGRRRRRSNATAGADGVWPSHFAVHRDVTQVPADGAALRDTPQTESGQAVGARWFKRQEDDRNNMHRSLPTRQTMDEYEEQTIDYFSQATHHFRLLERLQLLVVRALMSCSEHSSSRYTTSSAGTAFPLLPKLRRAPSPSIGTSRGYTLNPKQLSENAVPAHRGAPMPGKWRIAVGPSRCS